MKIVLPVVIATALTIPVYFGLAMIDSLARWVGSPQAWELLTPLFHLFGADGIESEEDVLLGVMLVFSFVIALCITRAGAMTIQRARRR